MKEKVYFFLKCFLVAGLCVLVWQTAIWEYLYLADLKPKYEQTTDSIRDTARYLKVATVEAHKKFIHDNEILEKLQVQTVDAVTNVNKNLDKSFSNMNSKMSQTFDTANLAITDFRVFIQDTNYNMNDQEMGVLPEIRRTIIELRGMVTIVIKDQIVGFLEAGTNDLNIIGTQLQEIFGNVNILLTEVQATAEGMNDSTFYIAQIAQDVSEVTEHYKNKILNVSNWQKFLQVLNITAFVAGEIAIPWLAIKKVRLVN